MLLNSYCQGTIMGGRKINFYLNFIHHCIVWIYSLSSAHWHIWYIKQTGRGGIRLSYYNKRHWVYLLQNRLGGLNNDIYCSQFWRPQYDIKGPADSVPSEGLPSGLLSPTARREQAPSECLRGSAVYSGLSSYKDTNPMGGHSTHMTSQKPISPNPYLLTTVHWESGLQHMGVAGTNIQFIKGGGRGKNGRLLFFWGFFPPYSRSSLGSLDA